MYTRFHMSPKNYERVLALTNEADRLYAILKNGYFMKGKMDILCDEADAEILLVAMRVVCPDEAIAYPVR